MINQDSFQTKWTPRILSVLRMVSGLLIMQHGVQKVFGVLVTRPGPTPALLSLSGIAGVLEFFGGVLLIIGLFTRSVAFILSGLLAVAYFMAHAPQGFWPIINKGELAALYSFVFLYLAVAGGGVWSVDSLWQRSKNAHRSGDTSALGEREAWEASPQQ